MQSRRFLFLIPLLFIAAASPATAYRGLAACPDFEPRRAKVVGDPARRQCQLALSKLGRDMLTGTFAVESVCLDVFASGGFPEEESASLVCQGNLALSTGSFLPGPADDATEQLVEALFASANSRLAGVCSDEQIALLDSCGGTVEEAAACITADAWEHTQHLVDVLYGQATPHDGSTETTACQRSIADAGLEMVRSMHEHMSECLSSWRAAFFGYGELDRYCVGGIKDGLRVGPRDFWTAVLLWRDRIAFHEAVAPFCDDATIAKLDACGSDLDSLSECVECAGRRETMYLLDTSYGGPADDATTDFIAWDQLANPILGLEDRRLKDQTIAYRDGEFFMLASQSFADDDPDAANKDHWQFRSSDLMTWQTSEEQIDPAGGPVDSPDLTKIDGLWHLAFQNPDPQTPENARIYYATSQDLSTWSAVEELHPEVLPGISIIDGSVAKKGGRWWAVLKNRDTQAPWFSGSVSGDIAGEWLPGEQFVAQSPQVMLGLGPGFEENASLLEIDGQLRMVATARDPEGLRCMNLFTCSHEPFIYTLATGDGSQYDDWLFWNHKTQLRLPYEAWNPVMHANTAFLNDWREHDGFFYLTYAGSLDSESFQGRGHGMIGIARSRDLVHWRVAGDLRD